MSRRLVRRRARRVARGWDAGSSSVVGWRERIPCPRLRSQHRCPHLPQPADECSISSIPCVSARWPPASPRDLSRRSLANLGPAAGVPVARPRASHHPPPSCSGRTPPSEPGLEAGAAVAQTCFSPPRRRGCPESSDAQGREGRMQAREGRVGDSVLELCICKIK